MDGWCLGRNVTQDCNGVFPIYCVAPFHQVRLSFIHCSQSPNPSPVSEEVQYIQSAFTDYIKIHHVDKFMLQESSLYPVFNTLIGDERCFVHGSDEFTQTITELLVSFGESFWKPLDITKIE
ncbi:hypothetical protein BC833DRAFT_455821 [Globomyces pollinis-pini]|nr:hypothetical protein BC833DRAFT_455821 [Globomyces pollinis-pini]